MSRSLGSLLALLFFSLACDPDNVHLGETDHARFTSPDKTAPCRGLRVDIGGNLPLVSRTTALRFSFTGGGAGLEAEVSDDGGALPTVMYVGEGVALVLPQRPWPSQQSLRWRVRGCGEERLGMFRTGELLDPVGPGFDETLRGRRFAIDLRFATTGSSDEQKALLRLLRQLGAALVVEVVALERAQLRVEVEPAIADTAGGYRRALPGEATVLTSSFDADPYAFFALGGMTLATTTGTFPLRDGLLTIGFASDLIEEAALEGTLELDVDRCADVAEMGLRCTPCDAADLGDVCLPVSLQGLVGLPL